MRHFLSATILALAIIPAGAQITIGPDDMPDRGDTIQYRSSTGAGLDLNLTGAGVTWDFSALLVGAEGADTLLPVSGTPSFYQIFFNNTFLFPQHAANYGQRGTGFGFQGFQLEDLYDFYKTSNTGFRNVGFGASLTGIPLGTRRIPVDFIHRFPMEYGNVDTSNSAFNLSVPSLLYFGQSQVRANEVDGWGTLILPGNTFEVLRQRSVLSRSDTIFIEQFGFGFRFPEPAVVEYRWLAKGIKGPVLTVTTTAGAITSVRFFYDPPPPIPPARPLVLFPNPAVDNIAVNLPEGYSGEWMIIDAAGREMRQVVAARPGTIQELDVRQLASGAYTLQLRDGPIAWSSRFVIRR
jgi:hypothetical protein